MKYLKIDEQLLLSKVIMYAGSFSDPITLYQMIIYKYMIWG